MRQIEIDSQTTLVHILSELKSTEDTGLEFNTVPNEPTVLDNPIHKKIIEKAAKELKKEVVFPALPIENAPELENDDLGFVEGEDIFAKAPIEKVHKMIQPASVVTTKVNKKKSFEIPKIFKNKLVLIGSGLALLILALGSGFYFLPSATISLSLNTDTKDSQITFSGDTAQKEVDMKNKILPMKSVEISKEGNDELTTTGKKTKGTYATGRVTITNSDSTNSKSFLAASTELTTATSSATFRLNNDVTIPQAPFGCVIVPPCPSVGVNVVANQPGAGSNFPANTLFKVNGQTNSVFAKNDTAFSGGSSQQVSVASSADRDTLRKQIIDKLTSEAKKDLATKNQNSVFDSEAATVEVVKEVYDPASLDAETNKLKATIAIKVKEFVFDRTDLIQLLVDSISKTTQNNTVDKDLSKITIQQTEKTSETSAKFIGKINAVLHPEIDKAEIVRQTVGKGLGEVSNYLDGLGKIKTYKVDTFPGFFKIFNRMPLNKNKIKVSITT